MLVKSVRVVFPVLSLGLLLLQNLLLPPLFNLFTLKGGWRMGGEKHLRISNRCPTSLH